MTKARGTFFLAAAIMLLTIVGSFGSAKAASTAEDVLRILRANDPELATVKMSLDGCQLSMRMDKTAEGGTLRTQSVFKADLKLFDLQKVRIIPLPDKRAYLIAQRKPTSDRLLDQAEKIVGVMPSSFGNAKGDLTLYPGSGGTIKNVPVEINDANKLSRADIAKIFDQPNADLVFRLTTVQVLEEGQNSAPFKPHKDAPDFYVFADDVDALEAPVSALIVRQFVGSEAKPDMLQSGIVMVPKALQFTAPSEKEAKNLVMLLYFYKQNHCEG